MKEWSGPVSAQVHVIRADGREEWIPATAREGGAGAWIVVSDGAVLLASGDDAECVVTWPETGATVIRRYDVAAH